MITDIQTGSRTPGVGTPTLLQWLEMPECRDRYFMNGDIRIQPVGPQQRDLLIGMYDRFDPLGTAFGLPPIKADARSKWIEATLGHKLNLGAFSPAGEAVGHCFLAADQPGSAELVIFVHQESRGRGVGMALVKAALDWGAAAGLRRVWSLTSNDNIAALRLQSSCGFRRRKSVSFEADLEIDLTVPSAAREMFQPVWTTKHGFILPHRGEPARADKDRNNFEKRIA